jgi:hypothetical protein
MRQGTTFRKVIRWLDAESKPKLIANWTGHMQIKSAYGPAAFTLDMTTDNKEITLIDGYITLGLSNDRTASIPVSLKKDSAAVERYFYELYLYDELKQGRCFMEGSVFVKGSLLDAL